MMKQQKLLVNSDRPFHDFEHYKYVIQHGVEQHKCPSHRAMELIEMYEREIRALFNEGCAAISMVNWLVFEWKIKG